MKLLEKIIAEMHSSMKSGHKEKASALRTLISKLKDQEIKLRREISDEETFKVIKTLVKQRKEAAQIYKSAGRLELAEKENFETDILAKYLPESLSDEDTLDLIKNVIKETNAKDLSDVGKVMPLVMQKGKGKVDGKKANIILRSLLE
tara:strand:+ start:149 stop:592 length:444 start_codon:yes stop_codon:yes gene_type:complete